MFVLRVSSQQMTILEVLLDYFIEVRHFDLYDLKDKVIQSEFYDDDFFKIVLKDLVKEEDPE